MQFLKLNLLLASLTAQPKGLFLLFREKRWSGGNSQLPITSPEWHCSLLHRVFPLPSPAVGPRLAGPFSCKRTSRAPRGKYQKQLSKCFLHRHHNLKIREIKSLNAEREGSFGCDIRYRFLPFTDAVRRCGCSAAGGRWKTRRKQPTTQS